MSEQREKLAAELAAIQARAKDKILHPRDVVSWAKSHPKSALHSEFEWNDTKAAQEHRLWQARRIIAITINESGEPPTIVSLRFDRPRGGGYRNTDDIIKSEELSRMMLADALADLERVRERYKLVRELASVWEAIDNAKVTKKRPAERRASA